MADQYTISGKKTRIIAHKHAEAGGMTHLEAEAHAADTELPVREDARKRLRVIAGRELPGRER